MPVERKHSLYGVMIDATLIGGITAQNVSTGTEVQTEPTSGEVYSRFQAVTGQKPTASFTTKAIEAAIVKTGVIGWDMSTGDGLSLWAGKWADGASRAATGTKYTLNGGILAPQSLSADHQGDATLSYQATIVYDGTNVPIVLLHEQTLPSDITDDERFTLGPVKIGGITLTHVRSLELSFGLEVVSDGSDSDIWDTFAAVQSINPVLTLRGIDLEWYKTDRIPPAAKGPPVTLGRLGIHDASTAIYLRKRAAGGGYVADGSNEHIKLSMDGLAYIDAPMDASGQEAAEITLTMPLKYDGSNTPVKIAVNQQIT